MKLYNLPSGPLMVNTYLVIDETTGKAFMVDPGGYDPEMVKTIEENQAQVTHIILTHGHGDHIGGIPQYQQTYPQVKVVAAKAEAPMLKDPKQNMSTLTSGVAISVVPDIQVEDGDRQEIGNLTLEYITTPGHSKGGMCIKVGNALFSGDTLFQSSIGRTDLPGGSYEELRKSILEKLFVLDENTAVYPGHMGATTIGDEKRNNPFL